MKYRIYTENLDTSKLKGVYLIRNLENNLLKIGACSNLSSRFKQIKSTFRHCGNIPELKIECLIECNENFELEKYLHDVFKEFRVINEWFKINGIEQITKSINNFILESDNEQNKILSHMNHINKILNYKNEIDEYNVPKDYIKNKDFSYKLYLMMFNNPKLKMNKENNVIHYEIYYINIKELIEISKISRQKILKQLNNEPYIIKTDDFSNRHLLMDINYKNSMILHSDIINMLILEEEMTIKTFIYLYSQTNDTIYGVTNEILLNAIGYSGSSSNNKSKLTKGINRLIKLGFIKRDIESNGLKKYSIYYKTYNK
jgi:hypothetical protein